MQIAYYQFVLLVFDFFSAGKYIEYFKNRSICSLYFRLFIKTVKMGLLVCFSICLILIKPKCFCLVRKKIKRFSFPRFRMFIFASTKKNLENYRITSISTVCFAVSETSGSINKQSFHFFKWFTCFGFGFVCRSFV